MDGSVSMSWGKKSILTDFQAIRSSYTYTHWLKEAQCRLQNRNNTWGTVRDTLKPSAFPQCLAAKPEIRQLRSGGIIKGVHINE